MPPLNPDFEHVVTCMTRIIFGDSGFDTTPNMINSFEEVKEHFDKTGRIIVWTGASDDTVFSKPEYNWQFRAWHDYIHIALNEPFTPEGEAKVCQHQMDQAEHFMKYVSPYPYSEDRIEAVKRMLHIEINGQVAYLEKTGEFPANQREFTKQQLRMKP